MFNPDPVVAGGAGFVYASSMIVAMQKLKLKEDEQGNKVTKVNGIKSKCKIMKTRYSKPFEQCTIKIPWSTGMDPYSGLFDMFLEKGLMHKKGNRYLYVDIDTEEEILKYQKAWNNNEDGCLDLVMKQFSRHPLIVDIEDDEDEFEELEAPSDSMLEAISKIEVEKKDE